MDPVIRTEHLARTFGAVRAVDDLTLEVPAGTVLGFLGPNGSGKTTTIRLLLGLLAPTAGQATVLGYDTARQADAIRTASGALLEHPGLYERLSAEDNLEFYGFAWRLPAEALAQAAALDAAQILLAAAAALAAIDGVLCASALAQFRRARVLVGSAA
jgi:ABC-type multidrug transport system ATPase subunit